MGIMKLLLSILTILILVLITNILVGLYYNLKQKRLDKKRKKLKIEKYTIEEDFYPVVLEPYRFSSLSIGDSYDDLYEKYQPTKGAYDEYFADELKKYFRNIKTDYKLGYKYPDIVLINKEKKFYLDIEIDEIYDFKSKKPTHFKGSDDSRNNYFNKKGWYVLRFTEDQIKRQTYNCCKFVAQVYAYYTLDIIPLASFEEKGKLQKDKKWSYDDAIFLARSNSRLNCKLVDFEFNFDDL